METTCTCTIWPLVIGLTALSGVLVLGYLFLTREKPILPRSGKKFVEKYESEINVTVKRIKNRQFLVDEDGKILDTKRISNLN